MGENLNWNFNLMDGVGGPAASMASALDIFSKKLMVAASDMDELHKSMKETEEETERASGGLAEFGLKLSAIKQIAGPLMEAGRWALDQGWDFEKKSIEALSFKESTMASFETLLGSAKEAQAFFSQAAWLGKVTPFQTKDVVDSYKQLLAAGYSAQEVPVVFQAIGDAAAMKHFDPQVLHNMGFALQHLMSAKQSEMGQALMMFSRDAAGSGFQRGKFDTVLAKNLGVDPESVQDLLSSGKVTAKEATVAIIDVLSSTAGGGIVGGGMFRLQDTFAGIMSTLESTFSDFFLTLPGKAEDVGGFNVLKGALMNMREALDTSKDAGKELQRVVVEAFSSITTTLFGTFSGPDGLKNMQHLVRQGAVAFQDLADVVNIGLGGAVSMVTAFLKGIGLMSDSTTELFSGPMTKEELEKNKVAFQEFGRVVGESMAGLVHVLEMLGKAWGGVKPFFTWMSDNPGDLHDIIATIPGGGLVNAVTDRIATNMQESALKEATMAKQPGGAPAGAAPQVTVNINGNHHDPAAVRAAALEGTKTALDAHAAVRKVSAQAGGQ